MPAHGPHRAGDEWTDSELWFLSMLALHDGKGAAECAAVLDRERDEVASQITRLRGVGRITGRGA